MLVLAAELAGCVGAPVRQEPARSEVAESPGSREAALQAPEPRAPAAFPDEPFRSSRPAPSPPRAPRSPDVARLTLGDGIEIYLIQQDRLPVVSMSLVFEAGAFEDPPGKSGTAGLCADLLAEGTRDLDKVRFTERLADLAAVVDVEVGPDTTTIDLSVLRSRFEPALGLLADLLRRPGLRTPDLERLRARSLARLARTRATPAGMAGRVFRVALFGAEHPFGRIATESSLSAVTLEDCRGFVARLRPSRARLFVAGQLSAPELQKILANTLAEWSSPATQPARAERADPRSRPARPARGTIFFVDAPGAAQSQIYVGQFGPGIEAPDHEATYLAAQILGGSFSSRINMNLREDKGVSYGARGGFSYLREGSYFTLAAAVETQATAQALREMKHEISLLRTEGITSEELERERLGRMASLPALFSTPSDTLTTLGSLVYHGLPLDWYEGHQERLGEIGRDQVDVAVREHLRDRDLVVVVAGDALRVLGDVAALADANLFGDGGLRIVDADARSGVLPIDATIERMRGGDGGEGAAGISRTGPPEPEAKEQ